MTCSLGSIVVNVDAFDDRAFAKKPGLASNPLTDGSLDAFKVYEVPMTSLTLEAVKPSGTKPRDAERSKNFFALGLICWLYTRPTEPTLQWIQSRFGKNPMVGGGQHPGLQGGLELRGDRAELVPVLVPGQAGRPRSRSVHQYLGQHRPGVGARRRQPAGPAAPVPR